MLVYIFFHMSAGIFRMDLKETGIGLIRLRIGIIVEPLWMWHWKSVLHKPLDYVVTTRWTVQTMKFPILIPLFYLNIRLNP